MTVLERIGSRRTDMSLLREGQMVLGTYEVERLLGEGAFAEVYRVKHRFLGRQALKVFKAVGMTGEEIEQMLGEAALLSRIGHPNIIRVFDANVTETSNGTCGFFAMEYVAGGTLEQFWRSHAGRTVPVDTTVELLCQVCRGLAVAHAEQPPIIHRDIKPQNILVGYDGGGLRARVSDFGLAKRVNPLTLLATGLGTRAFKAPEVLRDLKSDSCAGDVWALGTTLYLLLTDRFPYADGPDWAPQDLRRFEQSIVPPSQLNYQVDTTLDQITARALALRPQDRYPNAQGMLGALSDWRPQCSRSKDATGLGSTDTSKIALGKHTPPDEEQARSMVERAVQLACQADRLSEAADLMEEAFNLWPGLREEHEYKLQLWRRGISG